MADAKKMIMADEDLKWRGFNLIMKAKCINDYLDFVMREHNLIPDMLYTDGITVEDSQQSSTMMFGKKLIEIADQMRETGDYMIQLYDGR